jgi:signal transduction histidine kinase
MRRVASGLQPDPPIVITLVYLVLVFPHFLTTYGLAVTAIQTPVIGGIYLAGNTAAFAIGSRIRRPGWRILTIVACYTGVALLAAAQNSAALSVFGYSAAFYWAEVASYPFVAVTIAVIRSVSVQLHSDEDALADSLREQVRVASRAQRRLTAVRRRLSHMLHSTIQAELIAASLGLSGRTAPGDRPAHPVHPADERIGRVDASAVVARTIADIKRELLSLPPEQDAPAREGIEGILAMWGTALRIEAAVDDIVWDLLDTDPARASAVVDALSEGLTNAVRHGRGDSAELTIRYDPGDDSVIVELRSDGGLSEPRHAESGIGLAGLRRIGSRVSIRAEDEQVVLTVVVA